MQESRPHIEGNSVHLAAHLLTLLLSSSPPPPTAPAQAPPKPHELVRVTAMSVHDLVDATQTAADWAEAYHRALLSDKGVKTYSQRCSDRDQAGFAAFWAAGLHALVARAAARDARQAARSDFARPDLNLRLPEQLAARQAWTECRSHANQAELAPEWLLAFARNSARAAFKCEQATREVLQRVIINTDVRIACVETRITAGPGQLQNTGVS